MQVSVRRRTTNTDFITMLQRWNQMRFCRFDIRAELGNCASKLKPDYEGYSLKIEFAVPRKYGREN